MEFTVALVIIFGGVKCLNRFNSRNNRIGMMTRCRFAFDSRFDAGLFGRSPVERYGPIMTTYIGTLPIQFGAIMPGKEHVQQLVVRNHLRVIVYLHGLSMARFIGT